MVQDVVQDENLEKSRLFKMFKIVLTYLLFIS